MKKLTKRSKKLMKEKTSVLDSLEQFNNDAVEHARSMLIEEVERYNTQDAAFEAIGRQHKTGLWKAMKHPRKGGKIGSASVETLAKWIRMFWELEK